MNSLLVFDSLVAILALVVGFLLHKWFNDRRVGEAGAVARRIVEQAERDAQTAKRSAELEAKEVALKLRTEVEAEARRRDREVQQIEQRVLAKEEELARKLDQMERRLGELTDKDRGLATREKTLADREHRVSAAAEEQRRKLETIAGLTAEEARRQVMAQVEEDARREAALLGMRLEEEAREVARDKAREVLATTIQRLAPDYTVETAVSVVDLPSDDMKGRIIGREGRNIRALEQHTGVDLIVDDTPEVVVISCHNPIRRELARLALERLVSDGRIHPGRIEEVVRKAEQELDEAIREAGQRAVLEVGIHGLHPELVKLVGMLKYRYSYAQNVLNHSIEAAFIAGAMAAELGLNEKQARRAALLHDIGKALTHEVEGSHAIIGGEIARKYGESAKIVNAIAAHHEEVKAETILAPLVDAADALSGARPGARREVLESYVKRLEDLERISNSFRGVEKSFAVQAGREIRIIVDPGTVPDDQTLFLARDVARKIEQEMTYPGQIKVTVIRETRASELAR